MMTRAQRLRHAAKFGFLSAHVKVSREGAVSWRHPQEGDAVDGVIRALFHVGRILQWNWHIQGLGPSGPLPTREAAIRGGLLALAAREEARA